jgi:hypothetical protein
MGRFLFSSHFTNKILKKWNFEILLFQVKNPILPSNLFCNSFYSTMLWNLCFNVPEAVFLVVYDPSMNEL